MSSIQQANTPADPAVFRSNSRRAAACPSSGSAALSIGAARSYVRRSRAGRRKPSGSSIRDIRVTTTVPALSVSRR